MTRVLVLMILLSSSAAGCIVATPARPVAVEERCPDDRYWDGHKCKKDKWEKEQEKEERKERKREEQPEDKKE